MGGAWQRLDSEPDHERQSTSWTTAAQFVRKGFEGAAPFLTCGHWGFLEPETKLVGPASGAGPVPLGSRHLPLFQAFSWRLEGGLKR